MQSQPRFTVVTFVLVTLTLLAFVSKFLAQYIVVPANKRLANAEAPFLQAGAQEHVAWYPVATLAFQEARRLDRPILLVVGAPWSQTARRMDGSVFGSVTVQKMLARNFICIRADAVETPSWMSAYLPLSRAALALPSGFQVWLLDSQARLYAPIAVHAQDSNYGESQFIDELGSALSKMQVAHEADFGASTVPGDPGPVQGPDFERMLATPQNLAPPLALYRQALLDRSLKSRGGGFPDATRQRLWPDTWNFMLATSGPTVAESTIADALRSPVYDLRDGGFFLESRDNQWTHPVFDKVAVINGEMCLLMAQFDAAGGTGFPYRRIAEETGNSLSGEFLTSDHYIRPCRIGDERANPLRSQHSSFTPRQLRSLLDGREREWAQQYLNLQPNPNPAMVPFLSDYRQWETPMFDRVMSRLHDTGPDLVFDREVTLATAGAATARLLQAARILHDSERIATAHELVGHFDIFRRGNRVVHELVPNDRAVTTFADAVAFADVELQDFLATSRVQELDNGAAVLLEALHAYAMPNQNSYRMALDDSVHRAAPDSNCPQICDDCGESANAAAIRLCWSYQRLLEGSSDKAERKMAAEFGVRSAACVTQFADTVNSAGPYVGAYAGAAALTIDDTVILCSGKDAGKMANDFAPKSPFRLVAPVAGPVYPNLLSKPGYYIKRRGKLTGPLTESEALKLLPRTLFIGS